MMSLNTPGSSTMTHAASDRRATAWLASLPIALLVACGDPAGVGEVDPITSLPRALSVAETEVIAQSNRFGLDLFREVAMADDQPNVIVSPLSASMALGMTLNGADAETFTAMRDALGFDALDQVAVNGAYRDLIDLLASLDSTVSFEIANSVWANDGVPFHQDFFDRVADAFDAATTSLDFADAATVDAINGWVDDNTNGYIDRIVDQLDPELVMLLINAIYFDAVWTHTFDPDDTRPQSFVREDQSTVTVDMMSLSDVEVPFGSGAVAEQGYTAVELPYGGEAFSMVVVVPSGDIRDFVGELTQTSWNSLVGSLSPVEIDAVSIPKFSLSYDTYLNDALKSMGMEVAFTPGADFSRMSPVGDQLCIAYVRQKTFMEVDEMGTRAAAVTAVGVGPTSFIGLIADRPFVLAIRERLTDTLLFMGIVGDPTASEPEVPAFENSCG